MVVAAHEVQKKNAIIASRRRASVSARGGIAYSVRPLVNTSRKCAAFAAYARAREASMTMVPVDGS